MPYFANAYLTMHEAPLSQVCVLHISQCPKSHLNIVHGHLASSFPEIYEVLVNFFEFSADDNCL